MPDKLRVQSPEVIAKAERFGVDLAQVHASGEDGTITGDDVFRAAITARMGLPASASNAEILAVGSFVATQRKRTEEAAAQARARAAIAPQLTAGGSLTARHAVASKGPAYALNPLVAQVRAQMSARGQAQPANPAPTLFAAGDTPTFTASGIPAEAVLQVPWQARHAVAAAPTPAAAYAIVEECNGADGEVTAAMAYGGHDGNADYAARVERWQVESMSDDQLYATVTGGDAGVARDELNRRVAALPLDGPEAEAEDAMIRASLPPKFCK